MARARRSSRWVSRKKARTTRRRWKPSYRRRYKKGGSRFAKAVKAVILKTAEKKYRLAETVFNSTYDVAYGGYPLNHNSMVQGFLANNTAPTTAHITNIPQGNRDNERNGDEIYAKGIMLRGTITLPADRKNAKFKLFLVEHNTTQGNLTSFTDVFHSVTGYAYIDPVQTDRWTLKPLGTYAYRGRDTDSSLLEGQRGSIIIKKWIPWQRKLRYLNDGTTAVSQGMKEQLSLLCVSFDNTSTLDTSTIGYIRMAATLHYGDP